MNRIKFQYIFFAFAIFLGATIFLLYHNFLETEKYIQKLILQEDLRELRQTTDNIKRHLLRIIPPHIDFYTYLQTHPDVYKDIQKDLELFIIDKYKFIYLLEPVDKDRFRFLVDTSRNDRASFGELYTPLEPQEYHTLSPHYFFHKELKNIWLTYINPVVEHGKIKALIVIDFSLEQAHLIEKSLKTLENFLSGLILFLSGLIAIMVLFAYFDYKRERKMVQAYEKLEKLNKELEHRVEEKIKELRKKDAIILNQSKLAAMGEMINMIAHQWRQPLNAISVSAINMQIEANMGLSNPQSIEENAKMIQQQAQLMSRVIDDFMDYARPEKKKERFDIKEMVEEVLKMIEPQLKNHNISIVLDLAQDLYIESYKKDLEHVLLNLLSNARDALDECGKEPKKIIIKAYKEKDRIKIEVKDNGCGIPKHIQERIFEPYFTTKEQGKGTGLGLYMSRKIVREKLKGDLFFESFDTGTTFIIEL